MVAFFHLHSMEQSVFVKSLKNPSTYGSDVSSVQLLQTHISFVALTDTFVYKIKKPVNFGFLDFSTLEKRKQFCEEEIRLNKRLCPEIYVDVVALTETKESGLEINGKGPVVDYAIKMNQFSQENIMTSLLEQGKVTKNHIDMLCRILVNFYQTYESNETIQQYGTLESVKQNIDENFIQTKDVIDVTIQKETYSFLKESCDLFFKQNKDVFKKRLKQDRIRDCHGDLHSGNIVLSDNGTICVFDCIEFNKRFRYIDVASDIGFLAMDLDFHNQFYLSSYLIQTYVEKSKDEDVYDVLNFYKSYRAYVRGKVLGFQLADPHIEEEKQKDIISTAQRYYDLSAYYAELFLLHLKRKQPIVFLVSGLTGTGKSTLASKLAVDYHATIINTDVVRKQLAGINTYERHHDEPNTGLYDPKNVMATYEKVIEQGKDHLLNGRSVVFDATFQRKTHRDMAKKLAEEHHAVFVPILCTCPDDIAKTWLEKRLHEKTVSDGRWEIYQEMKKTFEAYEKTEEHVMVDMSKETYQDQMIQFQKILSFIKQR